MNKATELMKDVFLVLSTAMQIAIETKNWQLMDEVTAQMPHLGQNSDHDTPYIYELIRDHEANLKKDPVLREHPYSLVGIALRHRVESLSEVFAAQARITKAMRDWEQPLYYPYSFSWVTKQLSTKTPAVNS